MNNVVHLCDCMDFMKDIPDKHYELAIVDPPYGIHEANGKIRARKKDNWYETTVKNVAKKSGRKEWDLKRPDKKYFDELFRVSKNQIIWGANYYPEHLEGSMGWIFWDKKLAGDFSDGELAFTSFNRALKQFTHFNGQHDKIHPTQKPIALYKWLLQNYAKPGDKIFDSHVGSGSIRIACHDLGFDFTGCELDKDYWKAQEERYQNHIKQTELFEFSGGKIK